jgi:hypothetical protein
MLGLFRRGRIDEATLDKQLDQVTTEAATLKAGIEEAERALSAEDRAAQLRSAESLLAALRTKLAGPISPEIKRRIVEILVESVQADTWSALESSRARSPLSIGSASQMNLRRLFYLDRTA